MKLGGPPGFEITEVCEKCGNIYKAIWHYGDNNGKSEGYAERLCCKE